MNIKYVEAIQHSHCTENFEDLLQRYVGQARDGLKCNGLNTLFFLEHPVSEAKGPGRGDPGRHTARPERYLRGEASLVYSRPIEYARAQYNNKQIISLTYIRG